jgi:hypothetical protein
MGQLHNLGEIDRCPDLTVYTETASTGGQYLVNLHTARPNYLR